MTNTVQPSVLPFLASMSMVTIASGVLCHIHGQTAATSLLILGGGSLLLIIGQWWRLLLAKKGSRKMLRAALIWTAVAICMLAFSYEMVPIYYLLCGAMGMHGMPHHISGQQQRQQIDSSRKVELRFLTTAEANLPWVFASDSHLKHIHPGASLQWRIYMKNKDSQKITARLSLSLSPGLAAPYIQLKQNIQPTVTLARAEEKTLYFSAQVAKNIPKNMQQVVLSYTLFPLKAFYQRQHISGGSSHD
jgi:cytochrome c oxidase assembly protein subunit 11